MKSARLPILALGLLVAGLPACKKDEPATGGGKLDAAPKDAAKDSSDGGQDTGADSQSDKASDTTGDVTEGGAPDLMGEVEPEATSDLEPDTAPDLMPDLAPDLEPDLPPDLEPDLPPDLAPDLAPDLPPDMPPCTLTADAGPSRTVPARFPVTLGSANVGGAMYAWTCDRADCSLSSTTVAQPVARPRVTTSYEVMITKGACMAMSSVTLTVPLRLVDTTPRDSQMAPSSGQIVATFSQSLDASTIDATTVELLQAATGMSVPLTISVFDRSIIIKPTGAYNSITKDYVLKLHGGTAGIASLDLSAAPSTMETDQEVSFQVGPGDTDPPVIESQIPSVSASAVKLNAVVQIHYNEPLDPSTVNATNVKLTEMVSGTAISGTAGYEPLNNTITFRPTVTLAGGTAYKITLADIADVSGNFFDMDTSWVFTTSPISTDVTPPSVSGSDPVNGAIDIPATGTIDVVMSEPIDPDSLSGVYIRKGPAGPPLPTLAVWDAEAGTARVAILSPLEGETAYSLVISGVTDWPGNTAVDMTIGFTTGKAPFRDDFEAGTAQWTLEGDWAGAGVSAHSGVMALSDSPTGTYPGSLTAGMSATSVAFDVSGLTTAHLAYWVRGRSELGSDFLHLEWSTDDGMTWTELFGSPPPLTGLLVPGYRAHTIVLPGMPSTMMKVRFRLTSNTLKNLDGFTIDDVAVTSP